MTAMPTKLTASCKKSVRLMPRLSIAAAIESAPMLQSVNICAYACPICAMLPERNITLHRVNRKMTTACRTKRMVGSFKSMRRRSQNRRTGLRRSVSRQTNTPTVTPHRTNVQLAPCQMPHSANTTSVLRSLRPIPLRLPPSGMYTYSVNHTLSVMCQRRKNSVKLVLARGRSKFCVSRTPISRAEPMAISE